MIQTKRGKDMLLYEGYTFTQNRMCKDGMRWQCSYPKCRAFCRMSSAGWLTPLRAYHGHPKPSEEDIKRRILRMEVKNRARSLRAKPRDILRNALPEDEYKTVDRRACYTRCIQRFRKSLLRKNSEQPKASTSETTYQPETSSSSPSLPPIPPPASLTDTEDWLGLSRPSLNPELLKSSSTCSSSTDNITVPCVPNEVSTRPEEPYGI